MLHNLTTEKPKQFEYDSIEYGSGLETEIRIEEILVDDGGVLKAKQISKETTIDYCRLNDCYKETDFKLDVLKATNALQNLNEMHLNSNNIERLVNHTINQLNKILQREEDISKSKISDSRNNSNSGNVQKTDEQPNQGE